MENDDEFNQISIYENLLGKSQSSYASILLQNLNEQNNQQRTLPKL